MVNYGDYSKRIDFTNSSLQPAYTTSDSAVSSSIFDTEQLLSAGDSYSPENGGWNSAQFNPYIKKLGLPTYNWSAFLGTDDAIVKSQESLIDLIRYYEGDAKNNYKAKAKYNDRGQVLTLGYGITNLNSLGLTTPPKTEEEAYKYLLTYLEKAALGDCIKIFGEEGYKALPNSLKEAMLDFAFKSGRPVLIQHKQALLDAVESKNWPKFLDAIYYTKDSNKVDVAGLHRRALSRVILATRDLPASAEIMSKVEELYNVAKDALEKANKPIDELDKIYNNFVKNYTQRLPQEMQETTDGGYKINRGDNYWAVARYFYPEKTEQEYKKIVNELIRLNGIDPADLKEGDIIRPLEAFEAVSANEVAEEANAEEGVYKINRGDNYWAVARYFYPGKTEQEYKEIVNELISLNGIDPADLKEGDIIKPLEAFEAVGATQEIIETIDISNEKEEEELSIPNNFKKLGDPKSETSIGKKDSGLLLQTFEYKVTKGQGFNAIARMFGIDPKILRNFNGGNDFDVNNLSINQTIKIPRIVYKVKIGDTFGRIAKNFGLSNDLLNKYNNLEDIDKLAENDKLVLPACVYEVQGKDTLSSIANKAAVSVNVLKSINGLKSDIIKPGQKLVLLYNDVNYNVSDAYKTTKTVRTKSSDGKSEIVQTETITTTLEKNEVGNRPYLKKVSDAKGNIKVSRHVFEPPVDSNGPLKGKTIIINAGHGYGQPNGVGVIFDSGTTAETITKAEKKAGRKPTNKDGLIDEVLINYDNAMRLRKYLNSKGARVIYLQGKANQVASALKKSENKADLMISVHINSSEENFTVSRTEFYCKSKAPASNLLANQCNKEFDKEYSDSYSAIKHNDHLKVLNAAKETNTPAILWEVDYASSPKGRETVTNPQKMDYYCKLVSNATVNYFEEYKKYKIHTVKKGDTLGKIATDNKTTVAAICALNPGLNSKSVLQLGQAIYVGKKN